MIIGLCDRWKKLPSEILAEDAKALQLLEIVEMGSREERNNSDNSVDLYSE